jgi:hypothetical protein
MITRKALDRHGAGRGRIVQTGGYSMLIEFGCIDGTVRCAVKVQQVPTHDGDEPVSPQKSTMVRPEDYEHSLDDLRKVGWDG